MTKRNDWHFPRSELAQRLLLGLASGITNHLTLFAPRRMGKTEFVLQDLGPAAQDLNYCVLYINLWSEQTDPAQVIVQKLYEKILVLTNQKNPIVKVLEAEIRTISMKGVIPFLGEVGTDIEFQNGELDAKEPTVNVNLLIDKLLQALLEAANNSPILIFFDEIQHLATQSKFLPLTAALRTALDVRKKQVKAVFTGSSRQGLLRMFNDSKAPFFNMSVNIPFPDLDIHFVEFMIKKFKEITKKSLDLNEAFDMFQSLHFNPHYFRNLIIKCLFYTMDLQEAYQEITSEISEENNFLGLWYRMSALDQCVFLEIKMGGSLYSVETLSKFQKLTKKKVSPSHVQQCLNHLVQMNLIALESRGIYVIENLLFADWITLKVGGELTVE